MGKKDDANATKLMDVVSDTIKASVKDGSYAKTYQKWFHKKPESLPGAS